MTRYGGTATEFKQVLSIDLESKATILLLYWLGKESGITIFSLIFPFFCLYLYFFKGSLKKGHDSKNAYEHSLKAS